MQKNSTVNPEENSLGAGGTESKTVEMTSGTKDPKPTKPSQLNSYIRDV